VTVRSQASPAPEGRGPAAEVFTAPVLSASAEPGTGTVDAPVDAPGMMPVDAPGDAPGTMRVGARVAAADDAPGTMPIDGQAAPDAAPDDTTDTAAESAADVPLGPVPGRHVIFRAAGRRFALRLADVREVVVPPRDFVRVPRAPACFRGVINLRGRVVPVVDLARLLGPGEGSGPAEAAADPATSRLLLLAGPIRDLGILVDEVHGIVPLADPAPGPTSPIPAEAGVSLHDGECITCLAVDGIIAYIVSTLPVTR
jgi:purine-binding chemotaxis protein CheW